MIPRGPAAQLRRMEKAASNPRSAPGQRGRDTRAALWLAKFRDRIQAPEGPHCSGGTHQEMGGTSR